LEQDRYGRKPFLLKGLKEQRLAEYRVTGPPLNSILDRKQPPANPEVFLQRSEKKINFVQSCWKRTTGESPLILLSGSATCEFNLLFWSKRKIRL
jgi:hypothetical protein